MDDLPIFARYFFIASSVVLASCKKELDVQNPNEPTPEASTNEQGIVSLAQGGIYVNGFKDLKYGDKVTAIVNPLKSGQSGALLSRITMPDGRVLTNGPVGRQ